METGELPNDPKSADLYLHMKAVQRALFCGLLGRLHSGVRAEHVRQWNEMLKARGEPWWRR